MSAVIERVIKTLCNDINQYHQTDSAHIDGYIHACKNLDVELVKTGDRKYEFIKEGLVIGRMNAMATSFTKGKAIAICRNKSTTLEYLKDHEIPTPFSEYFDPESGYKTALNYWKCLSGTEIVIKPSDSNSGKGITTIVESGNDFRKGWEYAKAALNDKKLPVIIEEKITGLDIRAVVVNGRFVCAVSRIPAHVVGDGHSNIMTLVNMKNSRRKYIPFHNRFPILAEKKSDCIPRNGGVVLLTELANLYQGGESVDVTDLLSPEVKRISEEAVKAVPGLNIAGVDLIVNDLSDTGKVIEINTHANFCMHYYPVYGAAKNPAVFIIRDMIASSFGHAPDVTSAMKNMIE